MPTQRPVDPARPGPAVWGVVAAALVTVLLGACQVAVVTTIAIDEAGGGELAVRVELDRETADRLTATGVSLVPEEQPGWTVESTEGNDVVQVTIATTFATPDQLAVRVAELRDGLDDEDPRLIEAIELEVADGAIAMDASVGLVLPSSAGADIQGWPTGEELAALARANDVEAWLVVTAPGPIVAAGGAPADVDGATVDFELPIGTTADLTVTSRAPTFWDTSLWTIAASLVGVLVVVLAVVALVRRRRAHRDAPLGRVRGHY